MAGNLKELREQIRNIKNMQQVTKAMKFVAAAKWRKAHQRILQIRPYTQKLDDLLLHTMYRLSEDYHGLSYLLKKDGQVERKHVCQVLITASRGLCGSFNSNLIKAAESNLKENYPGLLATGMVTIVCIGTKGLKYCRKHLNHCEIVEDYADLLHDMDPEQLDELTTFLFDGFRKDDFQEVDIVYASFKNGASQFPLVKRWLPISIDSTKKRFEKIKPNFILDPDPKTVFKAILPEILEQELFEYLLETNASEQGARLNAMSQATDNAGKLLGEKKIIYNKARQAIITNELMEIISGADALNG